MNKKILKVNELKISQPMIEHDYLVEMARINNKNEFPFDVFVYGGDSYGSGRNEHGKPHFHFADKINGGKWKFSILIPTKTEWNQNKNLYIYETSNGDYNWTGLKKEKSELIKWLDEKNYDDKSKTNLELIRFFWNFLNKDNNNVKQIK